MKRIALIGVIVFIVGFLGSMLGSIILGFSSLGSTQFNFFGSSSESASTNEIVNTDLAEEVDINIDLGVGQVFVTSGTNHLLEGDFIFDAETGRPEVDYHENDSLGVLNISQAPRNKILNIGFNTTANHDEWNIKLNEHIPMNLQLKTGVGESELNLSELNLTKLDIETGVGETRIDLKGEWHSSFDMKIQTGVGETVIDLNGAWHDHFDLEIKTGVGDTTVIIPRDLGVKLQVSKGIGSLSVDGFYKNGNEYVNAAYETADETMNINLRMGIGEVTILSEN